MSAIAETIGKYGILGLLAAFVPAFVHGAMAGAVGLSGNPAIATIQIIAYMAIVAYWARHSVVDGLLAGIGLGAGVVAVSQAHDLAIQGILFGIGTLINTIVDYIISGFLMGLGYGFLMGISPTAILAGLAGFLFGVVVMLLVRVGNLLTEALELGITALFKNLSVGYAALIAPFVGGIFVGVPLGVMLLVFGFALAMGLGFVVGLAIASLLFMFGLVWAFIGFILNIGLLVAALVIFKTFTKSTDVIQILLDLAVIFIFKFIGPALYAAGYAGLVTRHRVRALYFIALGALGS
ncbi:hypothetical protein PyrSV_gp17 [Pyrobaculum spherical virus]|jgi:hypothetical protein|uniref:Uncharacterized protein n=1 Tax=Pyrobaculum spherical virus (isolate United States/Yellowstone) TaxID=654907 RepID=Q6ZYI6_PSVY|nr:hypothetical protein PyrSV_gp17 [Pyrobaculum spherical virus]CAG25636.1 hypothetical protein [Pyrobaculum spherical virus]